MQIVDGIPAVHSWFRDSWPDRRTYKNGSSYNVKINFTRQKSVSFTNWGCVRDATKTFKDSTEGRAQAHIVVDLVTKLEDAVTQMQGGSSRVSNLLIACMRKTEDWLAAQRSNFEDHRPWLAYKRVLIKLESDRHCSHLTTAVKEWMDECVTHEHHVDEVCVHYKPLIGSVRGAWNQEHLLDYRHLRTLTQPLMDECLTQHWDAAVPWSAGLLEESSSNHPSRRSSQTGNASGTHVPQAAPHLPNPALANTAQHSHREQLWDNSHVEHPQYNAEEAQQSQPAVEPGFTQTADTDTSYPNMLMPDSVRSPWTQHDKSCIDSALQAPGAAEQLEQQLQQAMHQHGSTEGQFWRPRAPGVPMFSIGDVAMLRDGQLYGTVPALSADTAHSSNVECLVVICDRPVAAAAIAAAATATAPSSSNQASGSLGGGLGYSPGCLEAIQGNWCVTEGPTYIWVDGAVRERALLIASTDLHNCAVAADPALISTLDRSIAVALETKNTPGKGMIIAFVSVALSAAQLVKQQAMAAISFDSLVGSLQREETRIEIVKEERKRVCAELLRTKQPTRSLPLLDNLEKVYDRPWHSVMLTPRFVTDSVQLSDQLSAAVLQQCEYNEHLQRFVLDYNTLLDGVQQAVLKLAIKNEVLTWNEGLQNVKTAKLIITERYGIDSDDVICLDNDILTCAYMKWECFDDAQDQLDNTLQLCRRKHGNNSLAAVQCLRNLAQIQRHKMEVSFQPYHAADFLNQALAALEFSTALVGDSKTLAIKAAVRFELAGVYLECFRAVEAHVALEQALQCARDYFCAHSPDGSCLAEADLHETMLAFAKQALHGNDPEVAIKVLDMQRQRNRAATSKRSWVVAFLVASAAVATGCTACATPMVASFSDVKVEASFSNIQIIIICILLVVVVRGARR